MYIKNLYKLYITVLTITYISIIGCNKFIEVDPPDSGLVGSVVYSSDLTAAASTNSIFLNTFTPNIAFSEFGIPNALGLMADEIKNYATGNSNIMQYYTNSLSESGNISFWTVLYGLIYRCNDVIEGVSNSEAITPSLKKQLIGEAKFMRALFYFYSVNLFGEIPLALTTDYKINNKLNRSPVSAVYDQIIADLKDAKSMLPTDYYTSTGNTSSEKVFPIKAAATALLARVYLYKKDWANAEQESALIIDNPKFSLLTDLNNVFKKNSEENIWQLGGLNPAPPSGNLTDGYMYVLLSTPGEPTSVYNFGISESLYNVFTTSDQRKISWIGTYTDNNVLPAKDYYYPYKYKASSLSGQPTSEYISMLRLAEQFLIRAEARGEQGKIEDALKDLNIIRIRAGLGEFSTSDKLILLNAIAEERRKELFAEWGHRWFDLRRTNTIDQVMQQAAIEKSSTWHSYQSLFPIPFSELIVNPNLKQNPEY
jgi:starch-binding outer membrane protein, SusD/RagB family